MSSCKLKITTVFIICLLLFYGCGNANQTFEQTDLAKFDKLVGNWASLHDEGSLYENWHKDANNVFYGESFLIADADTVFKTNFIINYVNGQIVKHINNVSKRRIYTVDYHLIKITDGVLVFQNDSITFPKTVSYKFTENEGFIINLDGEMGGQPMHDEFVFVANTY